MNRFFNTLFLPHSSGKACCGGLFEFLLGKFAPANATHIFVLMCGVAGYLNYTGVADRMPAGFLSNFLNMLNLGRFGIAPQQWYQYLTCIGLVWTGLSCLPNVFGKFWANHFGFSLLKTNIMYLVGACCFWAMKINGLNWESLMVYAFAMGWFAGGSWQLRDSRKRWFWAIGNQLFWFVQMLHCYNSGVAALTNYQHLVLKCVWFKGAITFAALGTWGGKGSETAAKRGRSRSKSAAKKK